MASTDLKPLVTNIFTADPSAHVFNGKLYVYPSHDVQTDIKDNDNGDQYAMNDYHVLSMEDVGGPVTDHGVVLALADIPWAGKQLWAPDAATRNGKYYLFFPARDKENVFRIGVAVGDTPEGPFKPEPKPIEGSFSIDPASFVDDDGEAYLYFGGIWGGQRTCPLSTFDSKILIASSTMLDVWQIRQRRMGHNGGPIWECSISKSCKAEQRHALFRRSCSRRCNRRQGRQAVSCF